MVNPGVRGVGGPRRLGRATVAAGACGAGPGVHQVLDVLARDPPPRAGPAPRPGGGRWRRAGRGGAGRWHGRRRAGGGAEPFGAKPKPAPARPRRVTVRGCRGRGGPGRQVVDGRCLPGAGVAPGCAQPAGSHGLRGRDVASGGGSWCRGWRANGSLPGELRLAGEGGAVPVGHRSPGAVEPVESVAAAGTRPLVHSAVARRRIHGEERGEADAGVRRRETGQRSQRDSGRGAVAAPWLPESRTYWWSRLDGGGGLVARAAGARERLGVDGRGGR